LDLMFPTVVSRYFCCPLFCTFLSKLFHFFPTSQFRYETECGGFFGTLQMHAPSSQGGKNNNQRILYASKFQTIKTTAKISPKIPKSRKIENSNVQKNAKVQKFQSSKTLSNSKIIPLSQNLSRSTNHFKLQKFSLHIPLCIHSMGEASLI